MKLRTFFSIFFLLLVALAGANLALGVFLEKAQRDVKTSNQELESLTALADDLVFSSQWQTRFARGYISNTDPRRIDWYNTIEAILNGEVARPNTYNSGYWDLVNGGIIPPPEKKSEGAVSIEDRFLSQNVTALELNKLKEARSYLDKAVAIERAAMHAVDGEFDDGGGAYSRKGKPDRALATKLLFSDEYRKLNGDLALKISQMQDLIRKRYAATISKQQAFGAALFTSGEQTRTQVSGVGSPAYMSPQQVKEHPLNHQTDIYSLGVVMYHLLTGRLPFQASNNFSLIYQITNVEPAPPSSYRPEIPPAVDAIVRRAMAKDLEVRYPDWEAFSLDLAEVYLPEGPIDGTPARHDVRVADERGVKRLQVQGTHTLATHAPEPDGVREAPALHRLSELVEHRAGLVPDRRRTTAREEPVVQTQVVLVVVPMPELLREDVAEGAAEGARGQARDEERQVRDVALGEETVVPEEPEQRRGRRGGQRREPPRGVRRGAGTQFAGEGPESLRVVSHSRPVIRVDSTTSSTTNSGCRGNVLRRVAAIAPSTTPRSCSRSPPAVNSLIPVAHPRRR